MRRRGTTERALKRHDVGGRRKDTRIRVDGGHATNPKGGNYDYLG